MYAMELQQKVWVPPPPVTIHSPLLLPALRPNMKLPRLDRRLKWDKITKMIRKKIQWLTPGYNETEITPWMKVTMIIYLTSTWLYSVEFNRSESGATYSRRWCIGPMVLKMHMHVLSIDSRQLQVKNLVLPYRVLQQATHSAYFADQHQSATSNLHAHERHQHTTSAKWKHEIYQAFKDLKTGSKSQ